MLRYAPSGGCRRALAAASYAWDLGDGNSGTGMMPQHTWTATIADVDPDLDEATATTLVR